jgi:long-chain acyl-CoA synthetase
MMRPDSFFLSPKTSLTLRAEVAIYLLELKRRRLGPLASLFCAMNLSNNLRATARKFGGKPALIGGHRCLTYRELDTAVMDLARRFLADGLVPGDCVAVHGCNTIEVVVTVLACFHAGLIVVPVNIRFKPAEVLYVLNHSRPRLCFCDPQLAEAVESIRPEAPSLGAVYTELPIGREGVDPAAPASDAPALVLYTSGTTAQPKGVTHTQRTLMASAETMLASGFDESTVAVVAMSMMHTAALSGTLLPTLLAGGCAVLLPRVDAAGLLDLIEAHRCTWTLVLPALMQCVAAEQERRPRQVGSMRYWLCGGDCVPVSLQERWTRLCGQTLKEGYGMSESMIISCHPASANRPGSVGRAAPTVEVRVVDSNGASAAAGAIGQIAVRSPANFIGYWRDPKATARTLVDGWLLTGDLGRLDHDGYLWFEGRLKEIIIRGGSNISPQEVEEALLRHAAVAEAGVAGAPDPVCGERVIAFAVLCEGGSAEEGELREFCRERLADYKVPDRVIFLSSLPKGITGKVQRRALKDLALARGL